MSALLTRARLLRYGPQLVARLAIGLTAGSLIAEAKAADTAQSLLADPARLAAVQRGCKTNQPWATDALCREAAQAIRLRFRGAGVPYRPRAVDPFPSRPQPAKPPGGKQAAPQGHPGRIL